MKNKKVKKYLTICIFSVISIIIFIYFGINILMFSSGYSEQKFNRITINNSYDDVTRLLGNPISRLHYRDQIGNIREVWFYSRSPLGLPYKRRWVSFFNGKVDDILKDYENSMD